MGAPVTEKRVSPRVTVLMPVYNASSYVRGALESILNQTYRDFEFLIIDDGSSDQSVQVISSYHSPCIRFCTNDQNLGVTHTLNKGLDLARGEYIVRMDADDISLPKRLERQVAFMDSNPEVGVCGAWVETFGESVGIWSYPTAPEDVRVHLLFHSTLAHPTVCLRREAFMKYGLLYDERYPHAEDFQLWQRASTYFQIANLGEVLLRYHVRSNSISRANRESQAHTLRRIDKEALQDLGIDASDAELDLHRRLGFQGEHMKGVSLGEAERWLQRLIVANDTTQRYSKEALRRVCGDLWLQVCRKNVGRVNRHVMSSSLLRYVGLSQQLKFAAWYWRSALGLRSCA